MWFVHYFAKVKSQNWKAKIITNSMSKMYSYNKATAAFMWYVFSPKVMGFKWSKAHNFLSLWFLTHSCAHGQEWVLEMLGLHPGIEGFGGKRALGFLLKTELCQKCSKFRMQFSLRGSNNVLHVFSMKFASFWRYYMYVFKKTHFSKAILWGPLIEWKTKPFVSLNHEVTIIQWFLTTASLAQGDNVLNGPDLNLFCPDTGSIRGRSK